MFLSFVRYYFRPTLKNWRDLRRICMARLPEKVKRESADSL